MKESDLIDHIQFPPIELSLFDKSIVLTRNESCLLLYPNKKTFIYRILPQLQKYNTNTLVISCMDNELMRNNYQNVILADTFAQMIKILEDLYNCDPESKFVSHVLDKEIKMILLHNVSAFYFDFQVLDQYNYTDLGFSKFNKNIPEEHYYKNLSYLIKKINSKYNCLSVVTSYDYEFNCGLQGSYQYNPKDEYQKFTKMPSTFVKSFNVAVHINKNQEIEMINTGK